MSTAVKRIEDILQSKFEMGNYVELVREIFSTMKLIAPDRLVKEYSNFASHVQGAYHVGAYKTPDNKKIGIFAVELKQQTYVENARSTQRSFAKKLIENGGCDAALISFFTPDDKENKWRLSFVCLDYEMKIENGKMKTEEHLTPAKRYSYLVGKGEPCHTAISRFRKFIVDNSSVPSLPEMEEAFSVEAVTKEFFELYCEKFYQLVDYLESNKKFKEESERCGFTTEQFAKKLLGQIVFLYFLQKKGWLGVGVWSNTITEKEYNNIFYAKVVSAAQRQLIQQYLPIIYVKSGDIYKFKGLSALESIPNDIEELIANNMPGDRNWGSGSKTFLRTWFEFSKKHQGHFYDKYLEPLFYATLNTNRGELGYSSILHCRVPFLSGGLFEPIDGYDWKNTSFDIPDEIFSNKKAADDLVADGILDIFDRYNFTMSEDEPLEREVAIDPEMLGKVFENLLDVKDRKSKGAFYTPREIVHYMCQESLVNYLVTNIDISESALRNFIQYGDFYKDIDTEKTLRVVDSNGKPHMEFDENRELKISPEIFDPKTGVSRIKEIDELLKKIRVADPAVGSGAFPLGMLNEIVRARQNLSAYMATEMDGYNTRLMYINERSAYSLKYETIRNCIFAADIEPSAVDIAQLRLWLALVIDDEINPDAQNPLDGHKNPLPLPNLECNIICGNSLIDKFEGISLVPQSNILGTEEEGQTYSWNQQALETLIPKLIEAQDKLFRCDDPIKKEQLKIEVSAIKDQMIRTQLSTMSESTYRQYEESKKQASKPYVLWQIDFARVFKEKGGFDIVIGNPPYFNVQTLGAKSPIVTHLMRDYSEIWMDKSDILFYFIYLGYKLSKDQVCYITSNAFLFSDKAKKFRNFIVEKMPIDKITNFENYMVFDTASITSCITYFRKSMKHKDVITKAKVLSENALELNAALYDDELYFDVNLEKNSNFALIPLHIKKLDEKIKGDYPTLGSLLKVGKGMETAANTVFLFDEKPNFPEKYIRRRVTGEMINRYLIGEPTEYLLYYEHVTDYDTLDPSVKKHLEENREFLENRATVKNEGRDWWKYSRPMHKEYYGYDKVWCSYRGASNCFAFDDTKNYIGFTNTVAIFDTNPEIDIKYILALVNSTLLEYQHKNNAKQTGGGIFEYVPNTIDRYPIPVISKEQQKPFIEIVSQIISIKKKNCQEDISELERALDKMVYELYKISEEEILIIEEKLRR